jgi:hypothetical protein
MTSFLGVWKTSAIGTIVRISVLLAACGSAALADGPASTTTAATEPPDKWPYTLFSPTPTDLLRDMDTDRPNVTNTPHTIDAGHLQIETGVVDYAYYRNRLSGDSVRENNLDFGQFNFRLGVLNDLELNAVVDSYDTVRGRDETTDESDHADSFGDTVVGGKLNLWGDDGGDDVWATALAIQPQFKFGTARDNVGNGRFEFSVAAPFLMNLPDGFHLGLQPGVSHERDSTNAGDVTGLENSVSIDRVVLGNLDAYLEYASDVTTEAHVEAEQTIDVGGTYPLTDNIVLDTGVNFGLNKASNNIELLAGISVRF